VALDQAKRELDLKQLSAFGKQLLLAKVKALERLVAIEAETKRSTASLSIRSAKSSRELELEAKKLRAELSLTGSARVALDQAKRELDLKQLSAFGKQLLMAKVKALKRLVAVEKSSSTPTASATGDCRKISVVATSASSATATEDEALSSDTDLDFVDDSIKFMQNSHAQPPVHPSGTPDLAHLWSGDDNKLSPDAVRNLPREKLCNTIAKLTGNRPKSRTSVQMLQAKLHQVMESRAEQSEWKAKKVQHMTEVTKDLKLTSPIKRKRQSEKGKDIAPLQRRPSKKNRKSINEPENGTQNEATADLDKQCRWYEIPDDIAERYNFVPVPESGTPWDVVQTGALMVIFFDEPTPEWHVGRVARQPRKPSASSCGLERKISIRFPPEGKGSRVFDCFVNESQYGRHESIWSVVTPRTLESHGLGSDCSKLQGKKAGKAKAVCAYHDVDNGLMCSMTKSAHYRPGSTVLSDSLQPCSKCETRLHHACFIGHFPTLAEKSGSSFRLCPTCASIAE